MRKKINTTTVLMTASDFAIKKNVSRSAVSYMIKENRIKAVMVGGIWLVQVERINNEPDEDIIEFDGKRYQLIK